MSPMAFTVAYFSACGIGCVLVTATIDWRLRVRDRALSPKPLPPIATGAGPHRRMLSCPHCAGPIAEENGGNE